MNNTAPSLNYKGIQIVVTGRGWFTAQIPVDETIGEPRQTSKKTYDEITEWIDRELAAEAKKVTVDLKVLYIENNAPRGADIKSINRSNNYISGPSGAVKVQWVLPSCINARELLDLHIRAQRQLEAIKKVMEPFSIASHRKSHVGWSSITVEEYPEVLERLEKEYNEKLALLREIDVNRELSAMMGVV